MARFLFTTFGSLGDLHPYLAIGAELVARGHAVTVLTHEAYRLRVTRVGMAFLPLAPDLDAFPDPAAVMRKAMDERTGSEFIMRTLVAPYLREQMNATRVAAADHDVLFSHPVTLMTPHVAEALAKPWASASLQPSTMFSRVDPPHLGSIAAIWPLMRLHPVIAELMYRIMMTVSRPMFRECDVLRGLPLDTTRLDPL